MVQKNNLDLLENIFYEGISPGNIAAYFVDVLWHQWHQQGLTDVVIAPGSRSTPLILGLHRHTGIRVHTHIDERTVGFFSLGLARASNRPVAIVTTSGTASVELHPAVVEANAQCVPLLILTADRPPSLYDVGAPQTIRQQNLFGSAVRAYVETYELMQNKSVTEWKSLFSQVFFGAMGKDMCRDFIDENSLDEKQSMCENTLEWGSLNDFFRGFATETIRYKNLGKNLPAGPIHCNMSFDEPLVPDGRFQKNYIKQWYQKDSQQVTVQKNKQSISDIGDMTHRYGQNQVDAETDQSMLKESLQILWDKEVFSQTGVIIVGDQQSQCARSMESILSISEQLNWPILADPLSGCRTGDSRVITTFDFILKNDVIQRTLKPNTILRFGPLPASKTLMQWLQDQTEAVQIAIDSHGRLFDPFRTISHHFWCDATQWCKYFGQIYLEQTSHVSTQKTMQYVDLWSKYERILQKYFQSLFDEYEMDSVCSEPFVARMAATYLPVGASLFVSSSMPIRDIENFASKMSGVDVFANRGANGIDGVVSTALGVATSNPEMPVVLYIGDIAFLYDCNALVGMQRRNISLTIVVIDNDGGGIFSFLPQHEVLDTHAFETYYGTPQGHDIEKICLAFGISASTVSTTSDFMKLYTDSLSDSGVQVIIVKTDRSENLRLHKKIQQEAIATLIG